MTTQPEKVSSKKLNSCDAPCTGLGVFQDLWWSKSGRTKKRQRRISQTKSTNSIFSSKWQIFLAPDFGVNVKSVSVKNCGASDCKWCHWPSFDSINAYLFYHQFYIDTDGNGGVGCRSLNLIPNGFRSILNWIILWNFFCDFFVSAAVTTIASSPSTRNTCTQIHLPWNMRARLSSRFTLTEINAGVCAPCSYWHLLSRNEMTTLISYWFYQRFAQTTRGRKAQTQWMTRWDGSEWKANCRRRRTRRDNKHWLCVELWMRLCAEYALAINGPPLRLHEQQAAAGDTTWIEKKTVDSAAAAAERLEIIKYNPIAVNGRNWFLFHFPLITVSRDKCVRQNSRVFGSTTQHSTSQRACFQRVPPSIELWIFRQWHFPSSIRPLLLFVLHVLHHCVRMWLHSIHAHQSTVRTFC